jgi:hypothetical protein
MKRNEYFMTWLENTKAAMIKVRQAENQEGH